MHINIIKFTLYLVRFNPEKCLLYQERASDLVGEDPLDGV